MNWVLLIRHRRGEGQAPWALLIFLLLFTPRARHGPVSMAPFSRLGSVAVVGTIPV